MTEVSNPYESFVVSLYARSSPKPFGSGWTAHVPPALPSYYVMPDSCLMHRLSAARLECSQLSDAMHDFEAKDTHLADVVGAQWVTSRRSPMAAQFLCLLPKSTRTLEPTCICDL